MRIKKMPGGFERGVEEAKYEDASQEGVASRAWQSNEEDEGKENGKGSTRCGG